MQNTAKAANFIEILERIYGLPKVTQLLEVILIKSPDILQFTKIH